MTKNMKKTDIRPFTRQLYRGSFWSIVLALGDAICAMIMNLMISWLIQQLSDLIAGYDTGFTLVDLIGLSGVTVGICLLMYILAYFGRPTFISRGIAQYKEYVFQRLTEKNISALSIENASVYISALSNDVTAIETNYLSNIFPFVECLLTMLGALVMMFCNNPQLTIVSIALSLLPLAASLLTGSKVAEAEKKVSACNSTYISTLTDCLTGFSVVKSFRAEKQLLRIFKENINKLMQTKRTRRRISLAVNMFASVAQLVAQFGVFIVAAFMAGKDSGITVGTVFIFVQLMNYVLNPIALFPRYIAEIRSSRALIRKLADALDNNVPKASATASAELESGIELRDITFGYEENKPVLKGISFTFEAGKSYAVVGASGSGKSTLLNLLTAAYHNYDGEIRFDNTELRKISTESLYETMTLIQQNVFIFNASIWDNITMFTDFPAEDVDRAIVQSGLSDLIAQRGKDYLCGENGNALSGGEKQRISIARALLRRSKLLLVDEATAALDPQTAYQVSDGILDLQSLTRIVVTHTLDERLLERYDCILALKNGAIIESGNFQELIQQKGYFYSLFTVSQ